MAERYDRIVVGAGILGLGHALAALKAGERVCVVEREPRAVGATVRNFGMVWPVGMRQGEDRQRALRSREIWLEFGRDAGVDVRPVGSLHLARHEDEWTVLGEFVGGKAAEGLDCELLSPEATRRAHRGVRPEGLAGAMHSAGELAIEPRTAADRIAVWLEAQGVVFYRSSAAVRCDTGTVHLADGRRIEGERVIVCSGADLRLLFPEVYQRVPVEPCKLQMLRLSAPAWRAGPHIAGGLTLLHYPAFEACSSLQAVKDRYANEHPFFGEHGIHVMSAQRDDGTLVVGDSHEYGAPVTPFDREDVNGAILAYLGDMLDIAGTRVIDRWHGVYAKRMDGRALLRRQPMPGVTVVNCVGGAGMTLGPAIAEETIAAEHAAKTEELPA
ncbi:MAG: TIGR03364 family FAD-dependent oxidoreductase [Phycisphaerales bacterium]